MGNIKIWCIFGIKLPELFINADDFDKALEAARKINSNYSGGYIFKESK